MDLSTIKNKKYKKIENFFEDVELMLNNAIKFNDSTSFVHSEAKRILKYFQRVKRRIEQKNKKVIETKKPEEEEEEKEKVILEEVEEEKIQKKEINEKKSKRTPKKQKIEDVHELTGIQNDFIKLIDKLIS